MSDHDIETTDMTKVKKMTVIARCPMQIYLDSLLAKAETVTLLDGQKGPALGAIQISVLGSRFAGALSHVYVEGEVVPGVYKILTMGKMNDGTPMVGEVVVSAPNIQSIERQVSGDKAASRIIAG